MRKLYRYIEYIRNFFWAGSSGENPKLIFVIVFNYVNTRCSCVRGDSLGVFLDARR